MAPEKSPALIIQTKEHEEKKPQSKYCSKFFLSWVLAALLIALIVALCVQFAFPIYEKHNIDIDTEHVFGGTPVDHAGKQEMVKSPWHLDFLINPTRLCDTRNPPDSEAYQRDPEIKLLVLVPSAVNHFENRRAIRKTWGSVAQKPHSPVRVGFILGTTTNHTEQNSVLEESVLYGDVIQADFSDTYRNLTTKSVMMFKWVTSHCSYAQYFLKADDDTFVNLDVISKLVLKPPFADQDKFIGGYVHKGAQPIRIPSEKHYVSESDYPNSEFPPYASGSAYLTTGKTATQLFDATQRVKPQLPLEDVYITGLCGDDISASLIHDPCFQYDTPAASQPASWDSYSNLATAHGFNPDDMDAVWNLMTKSLTDTIAMLEGGQSSGQGSMDLQDRSPSIFDVLDLMGMKPVSMSMSIGNADKGNRLWDNLFNWPMTNQAFPSDISGHRVNDFPSVDKKAKNPAPPRASAFAGSSDPVFKFIQDALRGQDNVFFDDNDRQPMLLPDFPLFPFGADRGRKPGVNMTAYVLLK